MKNKLLWIWIVSILLLQSCATPKIMKMAPVSTVDQKTGYDGTVTSHKKHFVSLSPYNRLANIYSKTDFLKDKTIFMLTVQNGGEESINIGYENISVVFEGNNKEEALKNIVVQKSDDFLNHWENEYNDNERKYVYFIIDSTRRCAEIDACNPMELLENLKYNLEAMRRENQALRETLPGILIKPQSLIPGAVCNGIIVCDSRDMDPKIEGRFKVTVSVDGEEHKFSFNRSLNK